MYLLHLESQKKVKAEVNLLANKEELRNILKTGSFEFDWLREGTHEIYAIRLSKDETVLGLMALKDVPGELRIEITLLESSMENVGENKVFGRIAGCLIAWACRLAFLKGYLGFVSLIPKTSLIQHYINTYGFQVYGNHLALDMENANYLIEKFLQDDHKK